MLVGAYPFEDPEDPRNFRKTIGVSVQKPNQTTLLVILYSFNVSRFLKQRILGVQYSIPDYVRVSADCKHLLSRIFVADPAKVTPAVEFIAPQRIYA